MSISPKKTKRRTAEQSINSLGYPPHYAGSDTPTAKLGPPSTHVPLKKKNIVKPLPRSEIEAAFQFFDIHNRKKLTPSDLKERLSSFYPHLANKEYKFLVSEGDFTIDTLVGILNHQVLRDFDPIREAFKVFDPNDTGYIDKSVLKKVLKSLGYGNITSEDMKVLIQTADVDGDGRISYEDWKNMTGFDVEKPRRATKEPQLDNEDDSRIDTSHQEGKESSDATTGIEENDAEEDYHEDEED